MRLALLSDESCADVMRAGGKGASLARMVGLDLPVPPGFVIPAPELERALRTGRRDERLRALLADVPDDRLGAAAEEARRILHDSPPDAELAEAVRDAYARLGDEVPVAVRSSACAEDSETASFAGQQETYLHVRGADAVIERVRDCWASFFSERALYYRKRKGALGDLGMAVVVQRMVDPDVAGVLFTIDPVRRRRDQMVVEAVFGLGEAVVSGSVTPDHYVIARDGRLKRSRLSVQPYAVVRAAADGTEERPLTPEEGGAPTLSDADLRRLAELGRRLEQQFGGPQDVEWALQDGMLYLLQSRPVTA